MKDVVNRMHVAMPQARDKLSRPPVIPSGVAQARAAREGGLKVPTEKDLQVGCRLHTEQKYMPEGFGLIAHSRTAACPTFARLCCPSHCLLVMYKFGGLHVLQHAYIPGPGVCNCV